MDVNGAQPQTGTSEVGVADAVVAERVSRCPDVSYVIRCSSTGSHFILVGELGYVSTHC